MKMKKIFYLASMGAIMAFVSCGSKQSENSDSLNATDTFLTADSLSNDSFTASDSTTVKTEPAMADMPLTDTASASQATETPAEEKVSKNNKQIDTLLKQCNNDIKDIKREGYDNGKPMDPAELQFSDVKSYIRTLRNNIDKLSSMQSEMSDDQHKKFVDVQSKANKIFNEIDL